jgi:hypothetical protein
MRLIIGATLIAATLPICANAAQVTAYGGDTPFQTVKGDNVIDGPHTLNCKDAKGCLLTVTIFIGNSNTGSPKTCVFVDGQDVTPKCDYDYLSPISKHAFKHIAQGTHTVEMHEECDVVGQVIWWETEYALHREP